MEKFTYRDYLEYLAEVQQNFSAMLSLFRKNNIYLLERCTSRIA